jgi:hypothetical protein
MPATPYSCCGRRPCRRLLTLAAGGGHAGDSLLLLWEGAMPAGHGAPARTRSAIEPNRSRSNPLWSGMPITIASCFLALA